MIATLKNWVCNKETINDEGQDTAFPLVNGVCIPNLIASCIFFFNISCLYEHMHVCAKTYKQESFNKGT